MDWIDIASAFVFVVLAVNVVNLRQRLSRIESLLEDPDYWEEYPLEETGVPSLSD